MKAFVELNKLIQLSVLSFYKRKIAFIKKHIVQIPFSLINVFLILYLIFIIGACAPSKTITIHQECHEKDWADKYVCYRPDVYESTVNNRPVFKYTWESCEDYSECEIESMIGNKCYVKTSSTNNTEILMGGVDANGAGEVKFLDLDLYKRDGKVQMANAEEAVSWDDALKTQLQAAADNGYNLSGYSDLTEPCSRMTNTGNSTNEPYEIARDSKYGCGASAFRTLGLCLESEVFQEFCLGVDEFQYPVDCESNLDVANGVPGREIYIKAKICSFDPNKEYIIQLTYKSLINNAVINIGEPIRIGYDGNFKHIKKKDPVTKPTTTGPVTFTIQAFVNHPSHVPGAIKTAVIAAELKEKGATAILATGRIEVKNFYQYNGKFYTKREFNIYVATNSLGDQNELDIRERTSFVTRFQKAYTDGAHIVGNFKTMYLPDYLIDKDGNAVLLREDFVGVDFYTSWLKAVDEWRRRCLQYFYLSKNN